MQWRLLIVIIHTVYIISIVLDQMSLAESRKYNVKDSRIKELTTCYR